MTGARGGRPAPGRTLVVLVLLGVAAALAIALSPSEAQASTTRLVIIAVGVVAAWRLLGRSSAVTASTPEQFEAGLHPTSAAPSEISSLRSVETDLRMSAASAFGLEFRLKPQLRELAKWRLMRNHGIDMDRSPAAAERIVGTDLWRLMRAASEAPEFRTPGAGVAEVKAAVEQLERI